MLCAAGALALAGSGAHARPCLTFCCRADNDLYAALARGGQKPARFDAPSEAVEHAPAGSAVLILADGYPDQPTDVPASAFERAKEKGLRLFVEYPAALPGMEVGAPRKTQWERVVVSSDVFGPELPTLSILGVHGCRYVPIRAADPLMVVARVAGFDKAVFGLPKEAAPILFQTTDRSLMVATTGLSHFVTGRYAPPSAWAGIWANILERLAPGERPRLEWTPTVHPAYGRDERLPADHERRALRRAVDWYLDSRLLVSAEREPAIEKGLLSGEETAVVPAAGASAGDGTHGLLEGYASGIQPDGSQLQRIVLRADCQAEPAAALALDSLLNNNRKSAKVAANLLDYVYFNSGMRQGARGNPKHPAYGLIAWGDVAPAWKLANYSDDDARVMLATVLAAACLKSDRWDEPLLAALLANLRTTGPQGFRSDRIDMPQMEQNGWKHYQDTARTNFSTHHESYLWACNLWAYKQTGYRPFLDHAKEAIRLTMDAFPDKWRWNDTNERSRMLLPLAWLVRVEDTPEHREWLSRMVGEVLARQKPSGGVEERVAAGHHEYEIPASNDEYGTTETPLIQQNGDAVTDQLYTSGFALLGLHEAAGATGNSQWKAAEGRLADYLCRIQVRSDAMPYLDGAWFRAFDFGRWDYWASSGDVGWGAWCIESGWGQAWTAVTLGLRQKKTTLWDISADSNVYRRWDAVNAKMRENDGRPWSGPAWPYSDAAAG